MAIVIPRSRSSGALSIESNARYLAPPWVASTLVIAAVSVVLPWSICPIVPTFTCGLLRTNFCFAMSAAALLKAMDASSTSAHPILVLRSACWLLEDCRLRRYAREAALFKTHKTSHCTLVSSQTAKAKGVERQQDRRSPRRELNP